MLFSVPGALPARVLVQGHLLEVGVDLPGHLHPLQQLPPEAVVVGEDLRVVADDLHPVLSNVVSDLDCPHEALHLLVVRAVLPLLRLLLQPPVVDVCLVSLESSW